MAEIRTYHFSDISKRFTPNAYRDISIKKDEDAVKESVLNILLTNKFERPDRPEFGCGIRGLLFKELSRKTVFALDRIIHEQLTRWEPRIDIRFLSIDPDYTNQGYRVRLVVNIIGTTRTVELNFFLEKIR